jgi:hypothetical protein
MNPSLLRETIREIITKVLNENAPAPSKPKTSPGPAVAPGKPGEKPKPRRPLGNPNVKPKPKASMNEEEMLAKIVARFKNKNENMSEALNKSVNLKKLLKANGFESVYKDVDQISPNDAAKVAQGMEIIFNNWDCSPNGSVIKSIIDYLKLKNNG